MLHCSIFIRIYNTSIFTIFINISIFTILWFFVFKQSELISNIKKAAVKNTDARLKLKDWFFKKWQFFWLWISETADKNTANYEGRLHFYFLLLLSRKQNHFVWMKWTLRAEHFVCVKLMNSNIQLAVLQNSSCGFFWITVHNFVSYYPLPVLNQYILFYISIYNLPVNIIVVIVIRWS